MIEIYKDDAHLLANSIIGGSAINSLFFLIEYDRERVLRHLQSQNPSWFDIEENRMQMLDNEQLARYIMLQEKANIIFLGKIDDEGFFVGAGNTDLANQTYKLILQNIEIYGR